MPSMEEKIASSISWEDLKKSSVLKQRILFTVVILIIYRLGSFVPLPGVNATVVADTFASFGKGLMDMFNVFTGGALQRMTIFALNIIPYISASIIISLLSSISPSMMQLKKEGEIGRQKINQYTRYLTVLICSVEAFGLASYAQSIPNAVINPGLGFIFTTIVTLVAGTMLVMWMGEQITKRGIGNGSSMIIFVGIVSALPMSVLQIFELGKVGQISFITMIAVLFFTLAMIFAVIFIDTAQRRVLIHYPNRGGQMGGQGSATYLPLKLNSAGVIPPIFAYTIIAIPSTLMTFLSKGGMNTDGSTGGFWTAFASYMREDSIVYLAILSLLILFFTFFYTAVQFNTEETSENLKNYGAFIPGVRPGSSTSEHLDYILTRITVIGALFLIGITIVPVVLKTNFGFPFLAGTSLLIVCNVVIETISQIQSHLITNKYESLMKKGKSSAGGQRFIRR
jgi:preprotein translocase subunit SecY